jgi:hypothetical protein
LLKNIRIIIKSDPRLIDKLFYDSYKSDGSLIILVGIISD